MISNRKPRFTVQASCIYALSIWGAITGNAAHPLPADAGPRQTAEVEKQCATVVSLFSIDLSGKPAHHGAGFFISADGRIATVRHPVQGSSRMIGETKDGRPFNTLGVVAADPEYDVVILKSDLGRTPSASLGSFDSLKVGTPVLVATDQHMFGGAILKGNVTRVENFADDYRWFALDAPVVKGHSGSPVLTESGQVVGVMCGGLPNPQRGMANSADAIKRLLAGIRVNAVKRKLSETEGRRLTDVSALPPRKYDELLKDPDFKAAMEAWDRKDNLEAARGMKVVIGDFPDSLACQVLLGSFYAAEKSWPAAEKAYQRALEINGDHSDTWGYLGAVFGFDGQVEMALLSMRRAVELKPASASAWASLGTMCVLVKRYEEARGALKMLQGLPTNEATEKARGLKQLLEKHEAARVIPKSR